MLTTEKNADDVPVIQEMQEALKLATRNILQPYGGIVGPARAVAERVLEEVLEERRVALQEVPMHAEECVLHLGTRFVSGRSDPTTSPYRLTFMMTISSCI